MPDQHVDVRTRDRLVARWVEECASGLSVGLIYLGGRLGLLAAMRDAGPITSIELAERTGLVERYVREWLVAMVASEFLDYAPADQRFTLSPVQASCFADPESLTYVTPMATFVVKNLGMVDQVAGVFREGWRGQL